MKVVKVHGALKEKLGGQGTFELDVFNPAEAIRALCSNFPGLENWIIDSEKDGIAYKVVLDKEEIGKDNIERLAHPWSEKEVFNITPVISGAGGGFGRALMGAALIGAAIMFAPGIPLATAGQGFMGAVGTGLFSAGVSKVVGYMGVSLLLGGVGQMISPTPKPGFERGKEATKLTNYSFSGITQTSQQGLPVPIVYGKCFIGSAVLSSGLDTDRL